MSKSVIITGASAGIGRAIAHEFARKKARIGLIARDTQRLQDVVEEVTSRGGEAIALKADVSDHTSVEDCAKRFEKEYGDIDIWINNAMVTVFGETKDIPAEEFKRETEVTYLGTVYGTLTALKRMWKRNKGRIIQVGSALSYRAIPLQAPYCASKHAVRAFTDSLRTEIIHNNKNIHVSMVQLPAHNTPQFSWGKVHIDKHPQPIPPIYEPEVAARAVYWAAHHERREVWVGASAVSTILFSAFFPELVDQYLAATGYKSQFADRDLDGNRRGNLFQTVKGDFGTKGVFTDRSNKSSMQFELEKIPVIHYFSNLIIAFIYSLKMMFSWIKQYA